MLQKVKGGDELPRYHVGVDTGKKKHHACLHDTSRDSYSKVYSFPVNRQGFEGFRRFLVRYGTKEEMVIGLEASGPYALTLGYFLLEQGYTVVELNPFRANQFRKAQGKKAKTDRVDAHSLAAFLAVGSYKPMIMEDPLIENLRELTRFRADLLGDRTRQVNRLQETLSVSFPELGEHLASLDSPTVLALLSAYPNPQTLLEAGVEQIKASISKPSHGHFGFAEAEAIFDAASNTVGLLRRNRGLTLKLEVLAQAILALNTQIKRVEAEIEDLARKLPHQPSDFPVGGIQSLASVLAEIPDISQFPSLKQFLSHFGWCPKTFQSGDFRNDHPRMSHAGNNYVRRVIWMLAIRAVGFVSPYREYFRRRTNAGKKKMHTIVAVARKLLSVIYAVLKTGRPYNFQQEASSKLALARP